jgi:hypothetical protein
MREGLKTSVRNRRMNKSELIDLTLNKKPLSSDRSE